MRLSAWAVYAVPALFVALGWLAWTLAGGAEGLTGTLYGRLMLAKLGAAELARGAWALNKTAAARALIAAPSRGRALLRRTLTAEAILFCAALGLVAWATTMTGPAEI